MGLKHSKSKEELLYEKSIEGDIEAIKTLSSEGTGLEWIDKEGKTPLMAACMNPERHILAKTLIELGANVNYYRPGLFAGTPLHHATKTYLIRTVRLLLAHGANPFLKNDDGRTPLDVARFRGFTNIARLFEEHMCLFSGWLTEFYGPGSPEVIAPKLLSRKIWVVVIPSALPTPDMPPELELAIYSNIQDAQPRAVVALWRADIEEPKLNVQDPTLTIFYLATRTNYKFAASNNGDKQQLQSFYLACRGISQVVQASAPTDSTQTAESSAINASLKSSAGNKLPPSPNNNTQNLGNLNSLGNSTHDNDHNGWDQAKESSPPKTSSDGWIDEKIKEQNNGWGLPELKPIHSTQTSKFDTSNGWVNSVNNASHKGWVPPSESSLLKQNSSFWVDEPTKEQYNGCQLQDLKLDKNAVQVNFTPAPAQSSGGINDPCKEDINRWRVTEPAENNTEAIYMPQSYYLPSAPPFSMDDDIDIDGFPIQYPSIDSTPVEFSFFESYPVGFSVPSVGPPPNVYNNTQNLHNLNSWEVSTHDNSSNGWGSFSESSSLQTSSSCGIDELTNKQYNGWDLSGPTLDINTVQANFTPASAQSSEGPDEACKEDLNRWGVTVTEPAENNTEATYMSQLHDHPSAPPIPMDGSDGFPIQYPSVDSSPVGFSVPSLENKIVRTSSQVKDEDSSCKICWEAPVEGACFPCGHMAGCMACLNEVQTTRGDCPICRTKILQVMRIYVV